MPSTTTFRSIELSQACVELKLVLSLIDADHFQWHSLSFHSGVQLGPIAPHDPLLLLFVMKYSSSPCSKASVAKSFAIVLPTIIISPATSLAGLRRRLLGFEDWSWLLL